MKSLAIVVGLTLVVVACAGDGLPDPSDNAHRVQSATPGTGPVSPETVTVPPPHKGPPEQYPPIKSKAQLQAERAAEQGKRDQKASVLFSRLNRALPADDKVKQLAAVLHDRLEAALALHCGTVSSLKSKIPAIPQQGAPDYPLTTVSLAPMVGSESRNTTMLKNHEFSFWGSAERAMAGETVYPIMVGDVGCAVIDLEPTRKHPRLAGGFSNGWIRMTTNGIASSQLGLGLAATELLHLAKAYFAASP